MRRCKSFWCFITGGLTEEEIAAFQAKAQAAQFTRGISRLNFEKQP